MTISILLGSNFPILRDSLDSIFSATDDLRLVGCAESLDEVSSLAAQLQPNLILLDASIAFEGLGALLDEIKNTDVKILLLSGEMDSSQTIDALCRGAGGVIGRKTTPDLLCSSIRAVVSGHIWISRQVASDLVQMLRTKATRAGEAIAEIGRQSEGGSNGSSQDRLLAPGAPAGANRFGLTKRELQIVNALVEGQTNKDIAATFKISEYTVKHHLTNIFDKLGVYNRVELVLFAINQQLCPWTPDKMPMLAPAAGEPRLANGPAWGGKQTR